MELDYVGKYKGHEVYKITGEGNFKDNSEKIYLKYNVSTGYYDMWLKGKKCGHCTRNLEVVDYQEPKVEVPMTVPTTSSTSGTDDFFKRVEKEIEETLRSEIKYG